MPAYQSTKTYRAGFYNSKKQNGADDRVYTAEDIRKPYDVIYSDGILPASDGTAGDTLKVVATVGMGIAVGVGNAKLGGAWFENWAAYSITLDTGSSNDRYDAVIIRNDDSDDVREPTIYIKSLSAIPTVNDLTRNDDVYEICVAYIRVPAFATGITTENIVDTREDGNLCNVMSGVGATVVRIYRNTYFSETANQTEIPIGIPQYNRSRDELTVIVEGRVFTVGARYTIKDNAYITLSIGLPVVGTRIDFEVVKNVNAAGAETVVQEVAELRREMTAVNKTLENYYYCNGVNDNINISNIVKEFYNKNFYHSMRLHVVGHFGFTSMAGGTGDITNKYILFDFGTFASVPKPKVIVDFTRCDEISVPISGGKHTQLFGGTSIDVVGVNIYAESNVPETIIRAFDITAKRVKAVDCRFWIHGYRSSLIAVNGVFENCYGIVSNLSGNSYCFQPSSDGVVKLNGGEYLAYTGSSSSQSAVVGQSEADAVSILYGVNAPTIERGGGFRQTHSLLQWTGGGIMNCTDLVSALPIVVVAGISEIRGTIAKSKPNLM